jgi:hypothetical protein
METLVQQSFNNGWLVGSVFDRPWIPGVDNPSAGQRLTVPGERRKATPGQREASSGRTHD